jgi:PAT family beta-lactamase induction signal transducer AmpG
VTDQTDEQKGNNVGWLSAARVYTDRRVIAILFLGFSSGMPLLLTFSTLSIWLAEEGISKTAIGLFALVGMPYSLKFIWAPLIDRLHLPFLTPWLGRRRSWAILTQLALMIGIVGLGSNDPANGAWSMAAWALFVTFSSASQDVVIDAYRVEIRRGCGNDRCGLSHRDAGIRRGRVIPGRGVQLVLGLCGHGGIDGGRHVDHIAEPGTKPCRAHRHRYWH